MTMTVTSHRANCLSVLWCAVGVHKCDSDSDVMSCWLSECAECAVGVHEYDMCDSDVIRDRIMGTNHVAISYWAISPYHEISQRCLHGIKQWLYGCRTYTVYVTILQLYNHCLTTPSRWLPLPGWHRCSIKHGDCWSVSTALLWQQSTGLFSWSHVTYTIRELTMTLLEEGHREEHQGREGYVRRLLRLTCSD